MPMNQGGYGEPHRRNFFITENTESTESLRKDIRVHPRASAANSRRPSAQKICANLCNLWTVFVVLRVLRVLRG